MERHKRFGISAVASSIVLAIASVVFSENLCYAAETPFINLLLICLRVNVYEEIPGNQFADHLYLPTKYLLLACATIFAIGFLWLKEVIPVPASPLSPSAASASPEQEKNDV